MWVRKFASMPADDEPTRKTAWVFPRISDIVCSGAGLIAPYGKHILKCFWYSRSHQIVVQAEGEPPTFASMRYIMELRRSRTNPDH